MEQTAFFVIGIVLVVIAVTVSAIGLRFERFPGSRVAMVAGASVLVLIVAATTTSAVINARDEMEERNEEAEAEQQETETEAEEAGESPKELEEQGGAEAQGAGPELSAPADGTLAYDTETLDAEAGEVTIAFDNPAAIEHDVTIEQDGEDIAQSELISEDTTEVSADLEPGEYVFYCSVPGHREGGMEGTLTVE